MMVAISTEQDFQRHPQIAGCLPWVGTALHEPGRGRVTERVRRDACSEACQSYGGFEGRLYRHDRLSIELDEMLRMRIDAMPASKVHEQPLRDRHRRLPLVGLGVALTASIV